MTARVLPAHLTYSEQLEDLELRHQLFSQVPPNICGPVLWDGSAVFPQDSAFQYATKAQLIRTGYLSGVALGRAAAHKPAIVRPHITDDEWAEVIQQWASADDLQLVATAADSTALPSNSVKCDAALVLLKSALAVPRNTRASEIAVNYLLAMSSSNSCIVRRTLLHSIGTSANRNAS